VFLAIVFLSKVHICMCIYIYTKWILSVCQSSAFHCCYAHKHKILITSSASSGGKPGSSSALLHIISVTLLAGRICTSPPYYPFPGIRYPGYMRVWGLLNCHSPGHNEQCKLLHCQCKLVDVSRGRMGTRMTDIAGHASPGATSSRAASAIG